MYDITHDLILDVLSYGKRLEELQYGLDHYIPRNIGDVYIISGISTHISYIKYLTSECWDTYLKYLKDREDCTYGTNCIYYKLLSDEKKIIEIEFDKTIKKYRKLLED